MTAVVPHFLHFMSVHFNTDSLPLSEDRRLCWHLSPRDNRDQLDRIVPGNDHVVRDQLTVEDS